MGGDLLVQIQAIDQAVLTRVVRKDQHDPDLVILDWTVEPIGHELLTDTTAGLFRFTGHGQSEKGGNSILDGGPKMDQQPQTVEPAVE